MVSAETQMTPFKPKISWTPAGKKRKRIQQDSNGHQERIVGRIVCTASGVHCLAQQIWPGKNHVQWVHTVSLSEDMADVICAVDLHSYIQLAATESEQTLKRGGPCWCGKPCSTVTDAMQTTTDLPVPSSVVKCCFCRLIRVGGTSTICPFASCEQNFTRDSCKHIKAAATEEVARRPRVQNAEVHGGVCDSPGTEGQKLIAAVQALQCSESRTKLSHVLKNTAPDDPCHNKHRQPSVH